MRDKGSNTMDRIFCKPPFEKTKIIFLENAKQTHFQVGQQTATEATFTAPSSVFQCDQLKADQLSVCVLGVTTRSSKTKTVCTSRQ